MQTVAVVLHEPENLSLMRLDLTPPEPEDVVVEIEWSGISTGTEKLLWTGRMPPFPGMGYPLVPGYESVGRIVERGAQARLDGDAGIGSRVFVPGARCYGAVRGLFGGAASRIVLPASRVVPIEESLGERGVLIALAATAQHALADGDGRPADLIVGHGVLGRLLARLAVASGANPTVWERNPGRADGAIGYTVIDPEHDTRRDYRAIYDVSGDPKLLDTLIGRLKPGGEIVLAGFYSENLSFSFPPAFMREARIRCAAQWQEQDLRTVKTLIESGALSLDGLITHRRPAAEATDAYRTAFSETACLKMILDWSSVA
jgi:3-hydroxyethyl bacteriochlorophyllide a dehydrogenase